MPEPDVRWFQRLDNYKRALATHQRAIALATERDLSELEEQGLIQAFEFTHELSWLLLKDFLSDQGVSGISGSRDAVREAVVREFTGQVPWTMTFIDAEMVVVGHLTPDGYGVAALTAAFAVLGLQASSPASSMSLMN